MMLVKQNEDVPHLHYFVCITIWWWSFYCLF